MHGEHRGVPEAPKGRRDTRESPSQTPHPTLALTHFLLLRAGCPPSPGAQRQSRSWRLGGRTPRFLAPPHAHAPVSLVTQKGGGRCPPPRPPGKGKERKCGVCWEVLGRQVLSRSLSPSHAGNKEAGCLPLEPRRHPDWPAQRTSLLPSPLGSGAEHRAVTRAGLGPRAQGSSSDLVGPNPGRGQILPVLRHHGGKRK